MRWSALALVVALVVVPAGPAGSLPDPQDDAGSGADAPGTLGAGPPILAGVKYRGTFLGPGLDDVDTYTFEAAAGDELRVAVQGFLGCAYLHDPDGQERAFGCSYGPEAPINEATHTAGLAGTWSLRIATLTPGPYTFGLGSNTPPPEVSNVRDPRPVRGEEPGCPGAAPEELTRTAGRGDAALPDLTWAALKTGFRAVVAWQSELPSIGSLTVRADGGPEVALIDRGPRILHLFVLDDLPVGAVLCFVASDGERTSAPHALHLANAMNAYDAATGTYSVNLLVLVNENVATGAVIAAGLDRYAEKLYDATDGHVRSGQVITVHAEITRHHSGWHSCHVAFALVDEDAPTCNRVFDVVWTHDIQPTAAALTYIDGIRDPKEAIWMNAMFEAPPHSAAVNPERHVHEVGSVLLHELGHYAFGAFDLYTTLGVGPDCFDPVTGISIMGADRDATEFDDEVNRCPNEAAIGGYVPSWTRLRARFPHVPDRLGAPLPGPVGDGGLHTRALFSPIPKLSPVTAEVPQDDGGSGRDAPGSPEDAVPIESGRAYDGFAVVGYDQGDFYAFEAEPGQSIEALVRGTIGCYHLHDPSGANRALACSYVGLLPETGPLQEIADVGGTWTLEVVQLGAGSYRFSVGVGEPHAPLGAG